MQLSGGGAAAYCGRAACTEGVWDAQASNGFGTCGEQILWSQSNVAGVETLTDACEFVAAQATTPECAPCGATAAMCASVDGTLLAAAGDPWLALHAGVGFVAGTHTVEVLVYTPLGEPMPSLSMRLTDLASLDAGQSTSDSVRPLTMEHLCDTDAAVSFSSYYYGYYGYYGYGYSTT